MCVGDTAIFFSLVFANHPDVACCISALEIRELQFLGYYVQEGWTLISFGPNLLYKSKESKRKS